MLDELNAAAETMGGSWLKLRTTDDPAIEGTIITADVRDKTFEGAVVLNRKTGKPRQEWVLTLRVDQADREGDADDGIRNMSLNESAQRAVATALREAKAKLEEGGRIKIAVKTDPPGDRDQAEYQARYTPPAKTFDAPASSSPAADDGPDPF